MTDSFEDFVNKSLGGLDEELPITCEVIHPQVLAAVDQHEPESTTALQYQIARCCMTEVLKEYAPGFIPIFGEKAETPDAFLIPTNTLEELVTTALLMSPPVRAYVEKWYEENKGGS